MISAETEKWLGPIFAAMFENEICDAFAPILQCAVNESRGPDGHGVDWIKVGQRFRAELGWENYPESPHTN